MKICLTAWAPFVAGAEVAVERLAVGLRESGHEVLLVVGTHGDALSRFRDSGIRCEFVPQRFTDKRKWLRYQRSRLELTKLLRREQPDLVHSNDLPTHQMTSDAARRLGIPRICHHRWIFQQAAIDWLNKFGAEQHLFVSHSLMECLAAESPHLAASRRAVVYDGLPIPATPTESDRRQAKLELQLSPTKLAILFAGQVIERKGVADLIHAWAALPGECRDQADLVVVGDDLESGGTYREEMQQLAAALRHPVRFMGFQNNVPRWLVAADIVLVPSHTEPLGNATLEAMAHGRVVIGCDVGGIPEMVEHQRTGLLVPARSPAKLASAMERLIMCPDARKHLGAEARRGCERRFSLDTHVQNVVSRYAQLVAPRTAVETL